MTSRLSRRRLLGTAGSGAAALVALAASSPAAAAGHDTEATITAEAFARLDPLGFRAVAVLSADGYSDLAAPVALTLAPEPLLRRVAAHDTWNPLLKPATTGRVTSVPVHHKSDIFTSKRDSFSAFFSGPSDPLLSDATYLVSHPAWQQPFHLFLVRIGRNSEQPTYETIFS